MYKLLIADDERLIREGLGSLIDWEAHGVEIVGYAEDGIEAYTILSTTRVDICVIDIGMPGLTGIEVITKAHERNLTTHFIILSGYKEFDYARTAIRCGVDNYLLKPVDEDELIQTLGVILKDLQSRDSRSSEELQDLREQTFRILYNSQSLRKSEYDSAVEILRSYAWEQKQYQLVRLYLPYSSLPVLHTWIREKGECIVLDDSSGITLLLTRAVFEYREKNSANRLFSRLFPESKGVPEGLCGNIFKSVKEMPQARALLNRLEGVRFFSPAQGLVFAEDVSVFPEGLKPGNENPSGEENETGEFSRFSLLLTQAVELGEYEHVQNLILKVIPEYYRDEKTLKGFLANLTLDAIEAMKEHHGYIRVNQEDKAGLIKSIHEAKRLGNAANKITDFFQHHFPPYAFHGNNLIYRKMRFVIERHYCENIKIKDLSVMLNYSSAYLGKLFKAESGMSFNSYVDQLRIQRAKKLLEDEMRVYIVAEEVGYSYVDYFHAKFRKYTGMSPLEYRKSLGKSSTMV